MITLRTFTISIMLVFMLLQSFMFGTNDMLSFLLVFIATAIIFNATIKLQIGNKKALRANAKKDSFLFNFLSNEKTLLIKIISFIVSLFFAFMLMLILKGVVINHGYWALFIFLTAISFTIFSLLNKETTKSTVVADNLQSDIAKHANEMLYVVLVALILNFILSLLLSAHDTMALLNSDITFENFDQFALKDAVEKTSSNHYTRLMINLYLLLDYFKLAITTKIIAVMIPDMQDRVSWFYLFYSTVFILNMMKLFAFSLSFVLMQKGMETGLSNGLVFINNSISTLKKKKVTSSSDNNNKSKTTQKADEENETNN